MGLDLALIIARRWRPGVTGAVIGAIVASGGFAVAAGAGVGHWLNLMSGSLGVSRWVIHAAPAVAYFAAIAVFGMAAALVLLGSWLHLGDAGPGP